MTMVGKPGKRERLYGLDQRIAEYLRLTNATVQYATDMDILQITEDLSVNIITDWPTEPICPPEALKAASRLGKLFSPFDIPTIYRMIGVKRL